MSSSLHAPLVQSGDDAHAASSSLWHIIQKAADKFMHYVSLTCMFVLPGFLEERPGGHTILYSVLTAVSLAVLAGTAVQRFHIRSIRIWPKVLDVATFFINFALLIYTLTSGKAAADLSVFLMAWGACVQNVALLCIVLGTLAAGMPFTMQIAKESIPEERWTSPVFITINYHVTTAWAVVFALQASLCLMALYVYP
jgi:uncharacterized membrane protein